MFYKDTPLVGKISYTNTTNHDKAIGKEKTEKGKLSFFFHFPHAVNLTITNRNQIYGKQKQGEQRSRNSHKLTKRPNRSGETCTELPAPLPLQPPLCSSRSDSSATSRAAGTTLTLIRQNITWDTPHKRSKAAPGATNDWWAWKLRPAERCSTGL